MKLIVGLGNPGPRYAKTRHNAGFLVLDELARSFDAPWKEKWNGEWAKAVIGREDVALLKPMTFMNESGRSVQPAAAFFNVTASADELLVVHDELDIPFADVRLKIGGGHAGHNGLRSIIAALGAGFARIRIGIGRPHAAFAGSVADFVLQAFDPVEAATFPDVATRGAESVRNWVEKGAHALVPPPKK